MRGANAQRMKAGIVGIHNHVHTANNANSVRTRQVKRQRGMRPQVQNVSAGTGKGVA